MKNKKFIGSFMLFMATLIWGLSYSIQSISSENLGPFTIVFFKGLGGIFLLPVIIMGKHEIDFKTLLCGMVIGIVSFVGCFMQQLGIISSTVSKASFITSLYIVFVPLLEVFSGKRLNKKIIISVLIALFGLYFLCFSDRETLSIGDIYLLTGSFFFALQIIFIDAFTRKHDSLSLTFISQSTICLFSLIFIFMFEKITVQILTASLGSIFYFVFISGMIAQTIQVVFQKEVNPSLASLIMSFEAVFGAVFGYFILAQSLSLTQIVGCILLFVSILIAEL